ncbi:curli-like amyloid fiber formation chaperone CsgH [Hymenobacter bucti]|uniref:Curli-like amyloid fiber formation chaperone CsgH n=1 Tax=Hymenobacter bucti TaxID=1844114 RepID=A0ABW4QPM0_9BACT
MNSLLLLLAAWQSAAAPVPCRAHLELRQQDGFLTVTSHCRSLLPAAARYRYELSLQRASTGGHSQNTQRGEFEVAPAQEVTLSEARVNVSAQDTYRIQLRVLDLAGHTVAQDSAVQGSVR